MIWVAFWISQNSFKTRKLWPFKWFYDTWGFVVCDQKWRHWALVDRPHLRGRTGAQFAKWDKGEEIRNGSPFESRKKALRRKSYSVSCANDAKKRLVVCDGERQKKGSRRRLRDWPGLDFEDNDACLRFAKTWSKIPRFKCFLEFLINILF